MEKATGPAITHRAVLASDADHVGRKSRGSSAVRWRQVHVAQVLRSDLLAVNVALDDIREELSGETPVAVEGAAVSVPVRGFAHAIAGAVEIEHALNGEGEHVTKHLGIDPRTRVVRRFPGNDRQTGMLEFAQRRHHAETRPLVRVFLQGFIQRKTALRGKGDAKKLVV